MAPSQAGGNQLLAGHHTMLNMLHIVRLDYLSCVLTVLATVLIGKKLWQGWVVAALNSAVVCVHRHAHRPVRFRPRQSSLHRPLHQQPSQLAPQEAGPIAPNTQCLFHNSFPITSALTHP